MARITALIITACLWATVQASQTQTEPKIEKQQFDGQRAMAHIAQQLVHGSREPANIQARQHTLNYIKQVLQPLSYSIRSQTFQAYGLQGTNIWASIKGESSDNKKDRRQIMLGAHWDSRPQADRDADPKLRNHPVMGANDGASGVAVLLEMARVLAAQPPAVTVDLVFFDLEDMGDIGKRPYSIGASQFIIRNPDYRPSAGVIVDMVCDKNLRIPRERHSQTRAPELMDRLWTIARQQRAKGFIDRTGSFINDDHVPFLDAGINVVDLIQYPFPDYWHSTADSIDKCSAESLQQVGNVLSEFIATY